MLAFGSSYMVGNSGLLFSNASLHRNFFSLFRAVRVRHFFIESLFSRSEYELAKTTLLAHLLYYPFDLRTYLKFNTVDSFNFTLPFCSLISFLKSSANSSLSGLKHASELTGLAFKSQKIHYSPKPILVTNTHITNFSISGPATLALLRRNVFFAPKLFNNLLMTKYLLTKTNTLATYGVKLVPYSNNLYSYFFSSRENLLVKSNLNPHPSFRGVILRRVTKMLRSTRFLPNILPWYYMTFIRFFENCSGKKILFKFNPFLENSLTFVDLARCQTWHPRLRQFQRLLGPKLFLRESLKILTIAFKFKDPTFLMNWITEMLQRMNFFKYRLLFRYLKFAFRYFFYPYFNALGFRGLKLKLKGKISVAGNARTRTLFYRVGYTSHAEYKNRVTQHFTTISTFTGVMGFTVWFYF